MKNFMRFIVILMISVLMLCILGSCKEEGETVVIKIGVFEPSSGENAAGGKQETLGIRYAHSVMPEVQVGDTTYKIELIEADNQSDPLIAPATAQSLIDKGASVVLGTYGSTCAIAAGSIFAKSKIPAIGASCTNPHVTDENGYYFRVCYMDLFQGTAMANWALELDCTKVGVLTQNNDDYSVGLGNYFASAFENAGGSVLRAGYNAGTTDFSEILSKFSECDAIFAPSSVEVGPMIIKQLRAIDQDCYILGGDTWENIKMVESCGAVATDVYFSTAFDETADGDDLSKDFLEKYKKWLNSDPKNLEMNGGNDTVAAVSVLGYDAYMAAIEAIKIADSAEGTVIREAIKKVEYTGITGNIAFDDHGDADKNTAYIKTIDVDNKCFKFKEILNISE